VKIVGTFPEESHPPIVYPAALVKGARPDAARFVAFLGSDAARAIFLRQGFAPAGDAGRR
jgi:molybdate transport system substrate-binding protein